MDAFFISNLKNAINISDSSNKKLIKFNSLIITDKLVIYNYLKKKDYKRVICLDDKFLGFKRKKFFIQNYSYFDKLLLRIGNKHKIKIERIFLNSIYNTFSCDLPRLYAGTKFILSSLDAVILKNKVKKLIYFNDLEHEFLSKSFYQKIFEYYTKKKKIKFHIYESKNHESKLLLNIIKKILKIRFIFQEFSFDNLIFRIKKNLLNINFLGIKSNIILEPAHDLNYSNFNFRNTKFLNCDTSFQETYDTTCLEEEKFKNSNFKSLDDIFISYVLNINSSFKDYTAKIYRFLKKKINLKNVENIYWGQSPSYLTRNLIIFLKKKYKVYGTQHGGSYFLTDKDIVHKNSDYFFCDYFLSYGTSNFFKKKNNLINNSLKEPYLSKITKSSSKNNQNLLYIPINLNHFFKPNFQSSQTERFKDQIEICKILNNKKYFKSYVKVLPGSFYKNIIFNLYNFETNPIYFEIEKFKNLKINYNTIHTAVKKIMPKVVICDFFSTHAYELAKSEIEIILMIDKTNPVKKDVIKVLKKRFHIINSPKQINSILKKIYFNNFKKKNDEFFDLFYKHKINFRI